MPPDRAPRSDGFIGPFFIRASPTIKEDLLAAIHYFMLGNGRGVGRLNQALITLIPKRPNACSIGDFRTVRLLHSVPKIWVKLLASRLSKRMGELVQINQSAFINGCNIHDNFFLVRQVARKVHKRKAKRVLLKLDISRAFDSLSWPFLSEVLEAKGFSESWRRRIAILLSTASSRVVVNGGMGGKSLHDCDPYGCPNMPYQARTVAGCTQPYARLL